jgi:hypothetical protein
MYDQSTDSTLLFVEDFIKNQKNQKISLLSNDTNRGVVMSATVC